MAHDRLAVSGYDEHDVAKELHASGRTLAFSYEILTSANEPKGWLGRNHECSITHNHTAEIKRTAKLKVCEYEGDIDWLSDRIRPWFKLKMPDGGWAEWPLGIFLMSTPTLSLAPPLTIREIDAYDQCLILRDDKVENRFALAAGANVVNSVVSILQGAGFTTINSVYSAETLPVAKEWKPGTTKLKIVHELLNSINYKSLYFNGVGNAVIEPYESPVDHPVDYTYTTLDQSMIIPEASRIFDLFDIPNKWVAIVSEPDRVPLSATYTNTNPDSLTSTVSRGRTIIEVIEEQEATSQAVLDELVLKRAFDASQVFETVDFETGIMPHHEDADVIELEYPELTEKAKFVEESWSMDLKIGAKMKHKLNRVVSV